MFYTYRQNNSGGVFERNEDLDVIVIIEAESSDEADEAAETLGIYFDGCEDYTDCPCCGDRWDRFYGEATEEPTIYGQSIQSYMDNDSFHQYLGSTAIVHRLDGSKEVFKKDD